MRARNQGRLDLMISLKLNGLERGYLYQRLPYLVRAGDASTK